MLINVPAHDLAKAGSTAARAARTDQRRRSAILGCCRLTAGTNLSIYGTDLDTGIAAVADCDVIEPGETVVDAHRLADIAAKLRGDVRIEEKSGELVIKCGRSRFALTKQNLDDYPPLLLVDSGATAIDLTAADVMALFDGAAAGAAQNDTRIYLSGPVLFGEPTDFGHRLCAVGADSVALSYAATAAACPDLGQGVIVHRDTCNIAVDLFGKTGAALRLGENLIEVASDSARLLAKLVDSVPSAWQGSVPPVDVANRALVANKDLRAAVERCLAVADPLAKRAPSVTIWWDTTAGAEVRIALGNIKDEAPAALDVVHAAELGGMVDISLNPKRLLRLIGAMDAESIRLSASDRRSDPMRIDAGPDRFAVLSPIRDFSHVSKEAA